MFRDIPAHYEPHYGVEVLADLDWSSALLQSNPFLKVRLLQSWTPCAPRCGLNAWEKTASTQLSSAVDEVVRALVRRTSS